MLDRRRTLQPSSGARKRRLALTAPQIAIWLDQSSHPQKPIYNTGQTLSLQIDLAIERFAEALNRVVTECDALRLRFVQRDDEVFQEIVDDVAVNLEYQDFSSEKIPQHAAAAWIEQLFWNPIGASDFPLFSFAVRQSG